MPVSNNRVRAGYNFNIFFQPFNAQPYAVIDLQHTYIKKQPKLVCLLWRESVATPIASQTCQTVQRALCAALGSRASAAAAGTWTCPQ